MSENRDVYYFNLKFLRMLGLWDSRHFDLEVIKWLHFLIVQSIRGKLFFELAFLNIFALVKEITKEKNYTWDVIHWIRFWEFKTIG